MQIFKEFLFLTCLLLLSLTGHAQPFEGSKSAAKLQQQLVTLTFHDVRDDVAQTGDRDIYAIQTQHLSRFLAWSKNSDWQVLRLEQVIEAQQRGLSLPEKSVLLTFDDGALSSYTRVFPLLKHYQLPGVFAIPTSWINGNTKDAYEIYGQGNLMTWKQMQEMQKSGFAEFVSHSHNLHNGILANPQKNMQPAAITHEYDPIRHTYETDQAFEERIYQDLSRSKAILDQQLGINTRAIFWPYGAVTKQTEEIAMRAGLPLSFSLGDVSDLDADIQSFQRAIVMNNPNLETLHGQMNDFLRDAQLNKTARKSFVLLDPAFLVDSSNTLSDQKLGQFLDQIGSLKTNLLILNAVTVDPSNQQHIVAYFPTSLFPSSIDVLNRIAWQSKTRAGQKVYAQLPLSLATQQQIDFAAIMKDLLKNNSALDGVVLDTADQLNCALNQVEWGEACKITIQDLMRIKSRTTQESHRLVNISNTFRTIIKMSAQDSNFKGLKQLLVLNMRSNDYLYLEIDPDQESKTFKKLLREISTLTPSEKQNVMVGFTYSSAHPTWSNYQKAYQELKRQGIQKLGLDSYTLNSGPMIHQQLYRELSLNSSAMTYREVMKASPQGARN